MPANEIVIDSDRLVEAHAHAVDGMMLIDNPGFVSGGSTQWLPRVSGRSQGTLFDLADTAPPGSGGIVFVRALSGSMAPRWTDDIRGCFAGLALDHGIEHVTRAVVEGCAYALRDIVDRLDALGTVGDEIRLVGGGHVHRCGFRSRPMSPGGGSAVCSATAPRAPTRRYWPGWRPGCSRISTRR